MPSRIRKILTGILYVLPVVFFVVCYFLISATEEDIAQGASTTPDIWYDLIAAFRNNARLADMYAWAVINFFDYQYSFGVDTIFRLADVVAAIGMLVLLTSIILGHRPRWQLRDATVYSGMFLLIILTPYGYTFYRGFSMIHNYLIIALAMLGFGLPFVRKLSGAKAPKLYKKWWFLVPMGLVFGLSANFPPLAFLATYIVIKIWQLLKVKRRDSDWRKVLPEAWEWLMISSMLVSMGIGYILGPGVSGYASDPVYTISYDYVALGDVLQNFSGSVVRTLKHIVTNFGRTLLPIVVALAISGGAALVRSKVSNKKLTVLPEDGGQRRLLVGLTIFSVFAVLAGSQIIMPVRLCLPAYLALGIVTVIIVKNWWRDLSSRSLSAVACLIAIVMVGVTSVRGYLAWDFHERVGVAFDAIREADSDAVCIDPNDFQQRFRTPFNIFQQEETFVLRRVTPNTIYGKTITYCTAGEASLVLDLDSFYNHQAAANYVDIRDLDKNYSISQAKTDGCLISEPNAKNSDLYVGFMKNYQANESAFLRVIRTTIEGDLSIIDVLYDATSDKVYLVRDNTRDRFSAATDRVTKLNEYEHLGEWRSTNGTYFVAYNGILEMASSTDPENTFVITVLD